MRWIAFFIFAYITLGIQTGVGPFVAYRDVPPNLMLLLVIFIALNAPREAALLAAFLLGLMQDLLTVQPLGLFAFSYGAIALVAVTMVESVRRGHPVTQLAFTFVGGIVLGMFEIVHDYFRSGSAPESVHIGPRVVAVSVIYTTLLAPFVIGLLQLCQRVFAFQQHGRRRK
jgi:rod shape-determining protein MreD